VNARLVNSFGWWQGFTVLVGLVIIMSSMTPLAATDEDDSDSAAGFAIPSMCVNWCESRHSGSYRAGTIKAATIILAVNTLQSTRDYVHPRHAGGRTVLDISAALRC